MKGRARRFVAEGTLEVGPQKDYFVFLDGEHLGSLLMLVAMTSGRAPAPSA